MILGISAAQGQGKSTVLSSLAEMGHQVIGTQTSRGILSEWGVSLADIDNSPELRKSFQEEIIKRHFLAIEKYIEREEVFLVERTFADIFAYTLLSMGSYNEYNEWLNEYYKRCVEYQTYFTKVFLLKGLKKSDVENDGVRSINEHFSWVVENTIHEYLLRMESDAKKYKGAQVILVNNPSHEERVEKILYYLEN